MPTVSGKAHRSSGLSIAIYLATRRNKQQDPNIQAAFEKVPFPSSHKISLCE
jgi:hypothetical protein